MFIPYEILNRIEAQKGIKYIIQRTSKRLNLKPEKYTLIKKEKMKQYENISDIKRPTTGFNSILWAIDNYKHVIIHGFDFFQHGKKEHYYDSSFMKKISNLNIINNGHKHDNIGEKKFVKNLIMKKKIIQLKDFLKEQK